MIQQIKYFNIEINNIYKWVMTNKPIQLNYIRLCFETCILFLEKLYFGFKHKIYFIKRNTFLS